MVTLRHVAQKDRSWGAGRSWGAMSGRRSKQHVKSVMSSVSGEKLLVWVVPGYHDHDTRDACKARKVESERPFSFIDYKASVILRMRRLSTILLVKCVEYVELCRNTSSSGESQTVRGGGKNEK